MTANHEPKANRVGGRVEIAVFGLVMAFLLGSAPSIEFYLANPAHGYSLSLGRQVFLGAFPFVDLISHYGPMVAFTSAAMISIQDSLVPETIFCATMYSLAIALLFRVVRVYSDAPPRIALGLGAMSTVTVITMMGRFYKWYFWLFPLLVLALLCEAYLDDRGRRGCRARLAVAGFVSGFAALYRIDLGAACVCATLAAIVLFALSRRAVRPGIVEGLLAAGGFALPLLAWLAILTIAGGHGRDYWSATFESVLDVAVTRGLPFPTFNIYNPFSRSSALAIALGGTAGAYIVTLLFGAWAAVRQPGRFTRSTAPPVLIAIVGAAIFPQTLHRIDAEHFVTVLPPMIALLLVGGALCWRRRAERKVTASRVGLGLLVIFLVLIGVRVQKRAPNDLEPLGRDLVSRYRLLALGPDEYLRSGVNSDGKRAADAMQQARLVNLVRSNTLPNETVLPYGIVPAGYFFGRRVAGLFPQYVDGIFDSPKWVARDRAQMRVNPPALVIVPTETGDANPGASMHDDFIRNYYRIDPRLQDESISYRIYVRKRVVPTSEGNRN